MESKIISLLPVDRQGSIIPIGDDCGEISWPENSLLASTDMIVDGEHFLSSVHSPEQVAKKALGVNISDVSAMAGTPKAVLVSLAIQRSLIDFAPRFMVEFIKICQEKNIILIGGDTNFTNSPSSISVTILGTPHPKGSILRRGAIPGDRIFVSGKLGGSLNSNRHMDPPDRSQLARELADSGLISSMMDISDGLATDLRQILSQSHCGAEIHLSLLPLNEDVKSFKQAFTDGEDFELLFTVRPSPNLDALRLLGCIEIGVITNSPELLAIVYEDGKKEFCDWRGFEHK
jgi:thiamine-monophosphate kinase